MKVKRVRIYLGHNNKTEKRFSKVYVVDFFDEYFSGYTIYETGGMYKTEYEEGYVIEYLNLDGYVTEIMLKDMRDYGLKYFEQYDILITIDEVEII